MSALLLMAPFGTDRLSNDLVATGGGLFVAYKDPEQRRQRQREWKQRNRERLRAENAAYRERHKEALLAKSRARYAARKDDPEWMEQRRQMTLAWRSTPQGRAVIAEYRERVKPLERARAREHMLNYRQGYRARNKLRYEIRKGRIVRPTECEQCGGTGRIEGAHHDYSKPLDVRWLCQSCHRAWDKAQPKLTVPDRVKRR
jgi:hypothetical protein